MSVGLFCSCFQAGPKIGMIEKKGLGLAGGEKDGYADSGFGGVYQNRTFGLGSVVSAGSAMGANSGQAGLW
jgi:hypothetical protein